MTMKETNTMEKAGVVLTSISTLFLIGTFGGIENGSIGLELGAIQTLLALAGLIGGMVLARIID